jgi:hypothetical protein
LEPEQVEKSVHKLFKRSSDDKHYQYYFFVWCGSTFEFLNKKERRATRRNNKARGEESGAINQAPRDKMENSNCGHRDQYSITFHLEVQSGAHSWSLVY